MNIKKISADLNMALSLSSDMREKSLDLYVGYEESFDEWELLIRFTGDIQPIQQLLNIEIVELYGGYGVVRIPQNKIGKLSDFSQIDYIEKPKYMIENEWKAVEHSCADLPQLFPYNLQGKGVLVACIDSGVDIFHEMFRKEDGTTKIKLLWDQTINGNPPKGFFLGTVFTEKDINTLIYTSQRENSSADIIPYDDSGHGTAVLGIIAQMAPEAEYIVVKMGNPTDKGFPRTTQFMMGMEFANREAINMGKPIAFNISYGNNYGAHNGNSIIEQYINSIANQYKTTIVAGTGNEGLSGRHASLVLVKNKRTQRNIYVSDFLQSFNVQIWLEGESDIDFFLESPSGKRIGPILDVSNPTTYSLEEEDISVWFGTATPYNNQREIFVVWTPKSRYIMPGIWKLEIQLRNSATGYADLWLPVSGSTTSDVFFVEEDQYNTLVIPSMASRVISVAAYNSNNDAYGFFSGRGKENQPTNQTKPDIAAPGVNVLSARNGGSFGIYTGTSFAAPFVTGAAALLMEWGIVDGNDPYLYGEKIRVRLNKGARPLDFQEKIPSPEVGWGALCLAKSLLQ